LNDGGTSTIFKGESRTTATFAHDAHQGTVDGSQRPAALSMASGHQHLARDRSCQETSMVDRISRISSSEASTRTEAGHTLNLGSDSQNAWVAARQSKINHDIEERHREAEEEHARHGASDEDDDARLGHAWNEAEDASETGEDEKGEPRLSGESERIGTQNFDDDTPFGDRELIV
jgi:hypothetical protein